MNIIKEVTTLITIYAIIKLINISDIKIKLNKTLKIVIMNVLKLIINLKLKHVLKNDVIIYDNNFASLNELVNEY